mmetsp:Transcript_15706/g.24431  ORF Transcript_15706/g.24431 Transcript_15706/m.24431 type:complete len:205 (+) Transcript_15706:441-1055(+)
MPRPWWQRLHLHQQMTRGPLLLHSKWVFLRRAHLLIMNGVSLLLLRLLPLPRLLQLLYLIPPAHLLRILLLPLQFLLFSSLRLDLLQARRQLTLGQQLRFRQSRSSYRLLLQFPIIPRLPFPRPNNLLHRTTHSMYLAALLLRYLLSQLLHPKHKQRRPHRWHRQKMLCGLKWDLVHQPQLRQPQSLQHRRKVKLLQQVESITM